MAKILGIISCLIAFGIWMNIVGNPHVVETVLGIIISIGLGLTVYRETNKLVKRFKKS